MNTGAGAQVLVVDESTRNELVAMRQESLALIATSKPGEPVRLEQMSPMGDKELTS